MGRHSVAGGIITAVGPLFLTAVLHAAGDGPTAGALTWREFTSKAGRFSALFPGEPRVARHTAAKVETVTYSAEPRKGGSFRVSYVDLPAKPPTPDAALETYAKARKAKVLSAKKIRLNDDFPGKEAVLELPGGSRSRVRIFITKKRQYHIAVEGSAAFVRSRDATKFLNSLFASDE